MSTADFMSERDKQDLRDAGRGHLLGEYHSPLDVADEARKRAKEEPMNTDKAEIESKTAAPTMDEAMTGVTNPVQNTGDDDIEAEGGDEAPEGEEEGPADDPFA